MTLLRGYSDDVPLHTWLTHMRAFELRMTADDIRAGLRLAMVEMLRSGTTGFVDMFAWDASLIAEVVAAGMRVNASPAVFGYDAVAFPAADTRPGSVVLDETPALAAEFDADPLVTVSYGMHAPYTCPPDLIADVARRAGPTVSACRSTCPRPDAKWTIRLPSTASRRSGWSPTSGCSTPRYTSRTPYTLSTATSNCWPGRT